MYRILVLCLLALLPLWLQAAPTVADSAAQGITVVSDTSDAVTDSAVSVRPATAPQDDVDSWLPGVLNLTGWLFLLPVVLFVLAPLLLLALLVWWLVRGRHRRSAAGEPQAAPTARRNRVVRNGAVGVGLVLMSAVMGWRLGVALGVLVACIAAGDGLIWWLDSRRHNDNK